MVIIANISIIDVIVRMIVLVKLSILVAWLVFQIDMCSYGFLTIVPSDIHNLNADPSAAAHHKVNVLFLIIIHRNSIASVTLTIWLPLYSLAPKQRIEEYAITTGLVSPESGSDFSNWMVRVFR